MAYVGYKLTPEARERLLKAFPPKYPEVVAHHITHRMGKSKKPLPGKVEVVGHVDDGHGVQAAVVSVNGQTHREDGKPYHVTISIDRARGRKPAHSNDVVQNGFTEVEPFEIEAHPHQFESWHNGSMSPSDVLISNVLNEISFSRLGGAHRSGQSRRGGAPKPPAAAKTPHSAPSPIPNELPHSPHHRGEHRIISKHNSPEAPASSFKEPRSNARVFGKGRTQPRMVTRRNYGTKHGTNIWHQR